MFVSPGLNVLTHGTRKHHIDVIMNAMASQMTCVSIVCSIVCSGADQRKHQSSASLVFVIGGFPSQRSSNAETVSIGWLWAILSPIKRLCGILSCIDMCEVSYRLSIIYWSIWVQISLQSLCCPKIVIHCRCDEMIFWVKTAEKVYI